MKTTLFEIEYEYHPKGSDPQISWIYVVTKCEASAKKHFETKMRELGWTKITTLKGIRPPKHANEPFPTRLPDPDADKRPSFSAKSKRKNTRKTTTATRRTATATGNTKKPGANRKNAGASAGRTKASTKAPKRTGANRRRSAS